MKTHLALLFSCALFVGCSVGTAYKQPPTPMPQAWANGMAAGQNWPDSEWWKQFNAPQLTALIIAARANNYDIKAAVARLRQANAQLQIAGAALLPSVDLDANSSRSQATAKNGTNKNVLTNANSASLVASYELDFWGKNRAAIASDQALANASKYDAATVELTTIASVANTYFDLLATQDRLTAAGANLASAQRLLEYFNHRQAQGLSSALDISQQENLVATQRATIPPLTLRLQQDKNALAVLVGRLPEDFDVDVNATYLSSLSMPAITPGLPSGLLTRRPDVQSAEANLISAHEDINAARAALFPDITLTANGGYASAVLGNLFKPGGQFFSLGTGLTQPIFHAGALSGAIELEKAKYDEKLQDYQKAVIAAFQDTENALAAHTQDAVQLADQQGVATTAQRSYDLSQQQFVQGVVDVQAVLNAERSLYSARDELAQSQLAQLQAAVAVYTALGGGWQKN